MRVTTSTAPVPAEVLMLTVEGKLLGAEFARRLNEFSMNTRSDLGYALVVNILGMSGYEPEVREIYMRWHKQHSDRLRRVAVVTDKGMWRLIVATIGMATGGMTRAFERVSDAERWAREGS